MIGLKHRIEFLPFAIFLVIGFGVAQAGDVPGSKDPPNFKRFEGSEIVSYVTRSYDQYTLARSGGGANGFEKYEVVEGAITRVVYRVPAGHTALELLRNYEKMLAEAGFSQTYELAPCGTHDRAFNFSNKFYYQNLVNADPLDPKPFDDQRPSCYFTAKATKGGQDITAAVLVNESVGVSWSRPRQKNPTVIKPGEILVAVDVIVGQAVENKMVVVGRGDGRGPKGHRQGRDLRRAVRH